MKTSLLTLLVLLFLSTGVAFADAEKAPNKDATREPSSEQLYDQAYSATDLNTLKALDAVAFTRDSHHDEKLDVKALKKLLNRLPVKKSIQQNGLKDFITYLIHTEETIIKNKDFSLSSQHRVDAYYKKMIAFVKKYQASPFDEKYHRDLVFNMCGKLRVHLTTSSGDHDVVIGQNTPLKEILKHDDDTLVSAINFAKLNDKEVKERTCFDQLTVGHPRYENLYFRRRIALFFRHGLSYEQAVKEKEKIDAYKTERTLDQYIPRKDNGSKSAK